MSGRSPQWARILLPLLVLHDNPEHLLALLQPHFWPVGGPLRQSARTEYGWSNEEADWNDVTVSGGRAGALRPKVTRYDNDYEDREEKWRDNGKDEVREMRRRAGEIVPLDRSSSRPPTRRRTSGPVEQFYNKLFWFGFDPYDGDNYEDYSSRRGNFNALEMLQQPRRSRRGRRARDPIVQDFGNVQDWNMRKIGTVSGDSKDRGNEDIEEDDGVVRMPRRYKDPDDYDYAFNEDAYYYEDIYDRSDEWLPPPLREDSRYPNYPQDMSDFDFLEAPSWRQSFSNINNTPRRKSSSSSRGDYRRDNGRRGLFPLPESKISQAEAYDRFIGVRSDSPEEEREDFFNDSFTNRRPSRHRRNGFAYKYYDDDDDDDDEDYYDSDEDNEFDVRPFLSNYDRRPEDNSVINVAPTPKYPRRRRSWEEREREMDRVPPKNAMAWGPKGKALEEDAQTKAALDAIREIEKSKKDLEKKEQLVESAKGEVMALKADASFYEKQLEGQKGRESKMTQRELGFILRDVEDALRLLRMAKAEREAAVKVVDRLETKYWALLSEFDAIRSFEND